MKPHVKLYFDSMGYSPGDFIPCECCGQKAVDIHHIESRGMGGTKKPDEISNLMAVCRTCHDLYGDKKQHMEYLRARHKQVMVERLKK